MAELGFNSLLELVDDISDVVEVRAVGGENKLFAKSARNPQAAGNVAQFEQLID